MKSPARKVKTSFIWVMSAVYPVASGDKVTHRTQKMISNKGGKPKKNKVSCTHTNTKAEDSENLHPRREGT